MIYKQRRLRHEEKYIISEGTARILRQRFRALLRTDSHYGDGSYRITSLYFDDIYRTGYNDKMNGMCQRKKYRIRAYNLDDSFIRLECKYKDGDYVSKRYLALSAEQYGKMLSKDYGFLSEDRFQDTVGAEFISSNAISMLRPAVLVDYRREAYVNPAGNVRITFDTQLMTSFNRLDMFDKSAVFSPVNDGNIILEVKYDEFIPSYIRGLLDGAVLEQQTVSKFILCEDKITEVNHNAFIR